ncbi:MAG: helix-turn-helix domain-containing protein [Candidatus Peregrinibacteria bacterium]
MHSIDLSQTQAKELRRRLKETKNTKVLRRLQCIQFVSEEEPRSRIATLLSVRPETISVWSRLFLTKGFDGLCSLHYEGRRPPVLDAVKDELKRDLKAGKYNTLKDVQYGLKEAHDITVCLSWIWRYAKKNSLVLGRRPN